jgi:hypothetical protein
VSGTPVLCSREWNPEFYRAPRGDHPALHRRARLTIVTVEADWPDAAKIEAYVRHRPIAPMEDDAFTPGCGATRRVFNEWRRGQTNIGKHFDRMK